LLATGMVYYSGVAGNLPEGCTAEQVMLDLATLAMWPIVLAPKLPKRWFEDLQELSSPQVARIVSYARLSRTSGSQLSIALFMRSLSESSIAFGLRNLLADMSDPKRGGAFLTAVAIADGRAESAQGAKGLRLVKWVLGAAAAGVIGNRVDALAVDIWDKVTSDSPVDPGSHGAGDTGDHHGQPDHDPFGSGGHKNQNPGSGLVDVLHDLFT